MIRLTPTYADNLVEPYQWAGQTIFFGRGNSDKESPEAKRYKAGPSLRNFNAVVRAANPELEKYGIRIGKRINTGFLGAAAFVMRPKSAEGAAAYDKLLEHYGTKSMVIKVSSDPSEAEYSDIIYKTREAFELAEYGTMRDGINRPLPAMLPRLGPVFFFDMDYEDEYGMQRSTQVYLIPREDLTDVADEEDPDAAMENVRAHFKQVIADPTLVLTPSQVRTTINKPRRGGGSRREVVRMDFRGASEVVANDTGLSQETLAKLMVEKFTPLYSFVRRLGELIDVSFNSSETPGTFQNFFKRSRSEAIAVYTVALLREIHSEVQDYATAFNPVLSPFMLQPDGDFSDAAKEKMRRMKEDALDYTNQLGYSVNPNIVGYDTADTFENIASWVNLTMHALEQKVAGKLSVAKRDLLFACVLSGFIHVMTRLYLDEIDLISFIKLYGFKVGDVHAENIGITVTHLEDVNGEQQRRLRIVLRDLGLYEAGQFRQMQTGLDTLAGLRRRR